MIKLYQAIFNSMLPMMCPKAMDCFTRIGDYFADECFTYVRVWESNGHPHILPLYILIKLLSQEISYQIVGTGITFELKRASNMLWPKFPLQIILFTLQNYKHAIQEILSLNELNIFTIPAKYFDPSQVVQNITSEAYFKIYVHEHSQYDDLFCEASPYDLVFYKVKQLSLDNFQHFIVFKALKGLLFQCICLSYLKEIFLWKRL